METNQTSGQLVTEYSLRMDYASGQLFGLRCNYPYADFTGIEAEINRLVCLWEVWKNISRINQNRKKNPPKLRGTINDWTGDDWI